jgi:hypothetical protein
LFHRENPGEFGPGNDLSARRQGEPRDGTERDGIELHGTGWDWDGIGTGKVETGHATGRDVGTGLESAERPAPGRQRDGTYRDRDGTGLNRGRIVHAA